MLKRISSQRCSQCMGLIASTDIPAHYLRWWDICILYIVFAQQSGYSAVYNSLFLLWLSICLWVHEEHITLRGWTQTSGAFPHPPGLSRGVYVGWKDSISPLHRLHRATLHFTNTEKTHIGNVHFKPLQRPWIYLLSVTERHLQHSVAPLFRTLTRTFFSSLGTVNLRHVFALSFFPQSVDWDRNEMSSALRT